MPIYEFACPHAHKFEKRLAITDRDSPQVCPECGGQATRIVSLVAPPDIQWPDSTIRKTPLRPGPKVSKVKPRKKVY